jgi:hypothetical protein
MWARVVTGRFLLLRREAPEATSAEMPCSRYQSAVSSVGSAGPLGLTASCARSERKAS